MTLAHMPGSPMCQRHPLHRLPCPMCATETDALRPSDYQAGQQSMRERVADVLRADFPQAAVIVERLPLHGKPDVDAVLDESMKRTKAARARELDAERVDSETMNFRMGRPSEGQEKEPAALNWTDRAHCVARAVATINHKVANTSLLLSRARTHHDMREMGRGGVHLHLLTDGKIQKAIGELNGITKYVAVVEETLRCDTQQLETLKADQADWRKGVALIASSVGYTANNLSCVDISEAVLELRARAEAAEAAQVRLVKLEEAYRESEQAMRLRLANALTDDSLSTWDAIAQAADALRHDHAQVKAQLGKLIELEAAYRESEQSMLRKFTLLVTDGEPLSWEQVLARVEALTLADSRRQQLITEMRGYTESQLHWMGACPPRATVKRWADQLAALGGETPKKED